MEIARSAGVLEKGNLPGWGGGDHAQWPEPGANLGRSFPGWLVPRERMGPRGTPLWALIFKVIVEELFKKVIPYWGKSYLLTTY